MIMAVIGIDSHKDILAGCLVDAAGQAVERRDIANTDAGHVELLRWVRAVDVRRVGIEAARAMLDQDIAVIHTFLGGAMFPTGGFVAENGGAAISASANTCFPGSPFAGASLFPPGDYLVANLRDFAAGTYREGTIRRFYVGIDPEPGAILCSPTDEEQATLDDVIARIGSRELVPEELIDLSG